MSRTDLLISRADARLEAALQAMDEGFSSKAAQKRALEDLGRAYDHTEEAFRTLVRDTYAPGPDHSDEEWVDYIARLNEFETPHCLHQVRQRHIEKVSELSPNLAAKIALLADVRAEAKGQEVAPPAPKAEKSEYEVKVERTLKEEMERLQTQYLRAVDLARIFNGVPVSANSHMVTNQHGTTFVRTFYFMDGKLTRLNLIIAAAEQVAREKAGK